MKKKKFSLNALMMNNKFLLVLSVIISLVIWNLYEYGYNERFNINAQQYTDSD